MAVLLTAVLAVSSTDASGDDREDNVDIQRESTQGDLDRDSIHFEGVRHEEIEGGRDEGVHEMGDDREDFRIDREEREEMEDPVPSNPDMNHESLHELENEIEDEKH
jgi:hypothetical protein